MLGCTGCTITVSIFERCRGVSRLRCFESLLRSVDMRGVSHIVEYRLNEEMNCAQMICCYSWGGCTLGLVSGGVIALVCIYGVKSCFVSVWLVWKSREEWVLVLLENSGTLRNTEVRC